MNEVKYIVLADEAGKEYPILFPRELGHVDVSNGIRGNAQMSGWSRVKGWLKPVSAGFYDPDRRMASGKSESLKLESRPNDAALINAFLRLVEDTPNGQ